MKIPLQKLEERHSVRSFLPESLSSSIQTALRAEATYINSHAAGLNFQIFFDDDSPLRGFSRSYGMFRNARNYLAAVIDPSFAGAEERAGYYAEQFVMKALELGLGSCFISGTYSPSHVGARMEVYERLPFIVVFGIPGGEPSIMARMVSKMVHGKERTSRSFFKGTDAEYEAAVRKYSWLPVGLGGVACAPSAVNRQPVRITTETIAGELKLKAILLKGGTPVDLGIAKYNFQAPLPIEGEWEGDIFSPEE